MFVGAEPMQLPVQLPNLPNHPNALPPGLSGAGPGLGGAAPPGLGGTFSPSAGISPTFGGFSGGGVTLPNMATPNIHSFTASPTVMSPGLGTHTTSIFGRSQSPNVTLPADSAPLHAQTVRSAATAASTAVVITRDGDVFSSSDGSFVRVRDVAQFLRENPDVRRMVTHPATKEERKLGARLLKTAAAMLLINGGSAPPPAVTPPVSSMPVLTTEPSTLIPPSATDSSSAATASAATASTTPASQQAAATQTLVTDSTRAVINQHVRSAVTERLEAQKTARHSTLKPNHRARRLQDASESNGTQNGPRIAMLPEVPAPVVPTGGNSAPASTPTTVSTPGTVSQTWSGPLGAIRKQLVEDVQRYPHIALLLIGLFALMCAVMAGLAVHAHRSARQLQKANAMLSSLNEELVMMRDKALEASRMKSEFVANISHEIRTPISAVLGMVGLLKDTRMTKKQTELASMLDQSARSLLTVINDILDFSKIEAGMLSVQAVDFSIPDIVNETIRVLSPSAVDKGIQLTASFEGAIPNTVQGDPNRLKQVLLNLIGNAIKFTSAGAVSVRVVSEPGPADSPAMIGFYVKDTGIGIPEDVRGRLFQPFSQADGTTTRKYGGTGLGLSISKRLVDLMGGRIDFRSESGVGSEFWFVLPFEVSETRIAAEAPLDAAPVSTGVFGRRKILVAEDSPVLQRIVLHQLKGLNCEVVVASTGLEAVEAVRQSDFDLILMDWQMPALDGIQATQEIRLLENGATVPIVAMTANAMEGDRNACLDAGMNDYISKPFSLQQLSEMIETWLPKADEKGKE